MYSFAAIEAMSRVELRRAEKVVDDADELRYIKERLARFALGEVEENGFPTVLRDEQDEFTF